MINALNYLGHSEPYAHNFPQMAAIILIQCDHILNVAKHGFL